MIWEKRNDWYILNWGVVSYISSDIKAHIEETDFLYKVEVQLIITELSKAKFYSLDELARNTRQVVNRIWSDWETD